MPDRQENEDFFARRAPPPQAPGIVEESRFYPTAERPSPRPPFVVDVARNPVKLGGVLFVVGWMGIIVQQGLFQQIVAGAPLFEEPAKVGGAIALAGLLSLRLLLLRLPIAAGMGAGFGIFEHWLTYAEEDATSYALRVAFHSLSAAASMAAFTALESDADVRLRWAATVPATLLHAANNALALLLGVISLAVPFAAEAATWWSAGVTAALALTLLAIVVQPDGFRRLVARLMQRFIPAMRAPAA